MVLLYGQSLLLSGVAADLAEVPGLQVERARMWEEASHLLADRMPDVLIFDLTETRESHVLPLLFKSPGMVMVGLDTEQNQAVLLSGRGAQSLTLGQIRQIAAGERRGQGQGDIEEAPGSEPFALGK